MKRSRAVFFASALLVLSGCGEKATDCTAFNKTFDELQVKQAKSSAAIAKRGVCHTRVEKDRKAKCPEYYTWLADATNFANFVASDKSTCTNEIDRRNALADLAELAKDGAFPKQ